MKNLFNNTNDYPFVFGTYQTFKKVLKYGLYIAIIYFAYEGFRTWY